MSATTVRYPRLRTIRTKLVGVSFRNTDGTPRQRVIEKCRAGDRLMLKRELDNPHDPFAVAVCTGGGEQMGYLGGHWAHDVAAAIDEGREVSAAITQITGGGGWILCKYRGVNVEITLA